VAVGAEYFGEERQAAKLLVPLEQFRQVWDVSPQDDVFVYIDKTCKVQVRPGMGGCCMRLQMQPQQGWPAGMQAPVRCT